MNLQIASGDKHRVIGAISDLQPGSGTISDAKVEHVAVSASILVIYGTPNKCNRDQSCRIASDTADLSIAMEVNDADGDLR